MKKLLISPLVLLAVLSAFIFGCEPDDPQEPYPPPNIDHDFGEIDVGDQTYKTIEIGTQTWMAENLNYETGNSWCYDDDPNNCMTYGRLYDWNTALTACPPGWHLPSDEEWTILTRYLGGDESAGEKMKSTGTLEAGTGLWKTPNTATNESGFSALPGGYRFYSGYFGNLGSFGFWWSSTEKSTYSPWYRLLRFNYASVTRDYYGYDNGYGLSVRCLKN